MHCCPKHLGVHKRIGHGQVGGEWLSSISNCVDCKLVVKKAISCEGVSMLWLVDKAAAQVQRDKVLRCNGLKGDMRQAVANDATNSSRACEICGDVIV